MRLQNEISFETEICDHLAAHGWLHGAVTGQLDVRHLHDA